MLAVSMELLSVVERVVTTVEKRDGLKAAKKVEKTVEKLDFSTAVLLG